mgnify:CR=1 FL=1
MPKIAPNSVFTKSTVGTLENFVSVPTGSAGLTYINTSSSAVRKPELRLDGKYGKLGVSKSKSLAVITIPIVDPLTLAVRFNTLRIEQKVHPEDMTVIPSLLSYGMNIMADSAFTDFWRLGRFFISE